MLMKMKNTKKGFTLVELMIVVAIIGILAALAIPAFMQYIRNSKAAEAGPIIAAMVDGALAYYEGDQQCMPTTENYWHSVGTGSCDGMRAGMPVPANGKVYPGRTNGFHTGDIPFGGSQAIAEFEFDDDDGSTRLMNALNATIREDQAYYFAYAYVPFIGGAAPAVASLGDIGTLPGGGFYACHDWDGTDVGDAADCDDSYDGHLVQQYCAGNECNPRFVTNEFGGATSDP